MARPELTFFCELPADQLEDYFLAKNQWLIATLQNLKATVSLGLLDLSRERAELVQRLNQAGVPVTAWLLLPIEQGYWFNSENYSLAHRRYQQFQNWSREYNLQWKCVGLDIEPDIRELMSLTEHGWRACIRLGPAVGKRLISPGRMHAAHVSYTELVNQIKADGYQVESYQFPLIADERKVNSTLIRRLAGLVDVPVDREVWMLYSSFFRPFGSGILWSYAPYAEAIGLGSTGGGVEIFSGESKNLSWDELGHDLRMAWHYCDQLYIFSLEGCVQQEYLGKFLEFQWDYPVVLPLHIAHRVDRYRQYLQAFLWTTKHAGMLALVGVMLISIARRLLKWSRDNRG